MVTINKKFYRHRPLLVINCIIILLFLGHIAGFYHWKFLQQLENIAYDARVLLNTSNEQDKRIIIVDIDENSLAQVGRWPWSRDKLASLVNQLFDYYHVAALGFDIVFAEPDTSSGYEILEKLAKNQLKDQPAFIAELAKLKESLDFDHQFANSLMNRPVVLGYYFNEPDNTRNDHGNYESGLLPRPILKQEDFPGRNLQAHKAIGYGANLAELQQAAAGGGHFNPVVDDDGIVRRIPLLFEYHDNYYESLSLAMVSQITGVTDIKPVFAQDTRQGNYDKIEKLQLGSLSIPVDEHLQALVPFRGGRGSFPYVSAVDVLNRTASQQILENAVVLVGASAPGLFDLRSTPVQNKYPGVEIHANLISGIMDGTIMDKPAYLNAAEFVMVLLIGILMTILIPFLTPVKTTLITLALLAVTLLLNYLLWTHAKLVMPIASSLMVILLLFIIDMSYGFFVERRYKGQLKHLFGQYVPPELVNEMSDNPQAYSLEPEDRDMTVLFSDVRNFTKISEGLDPKELSELMNHFLTPFTRLIHENGGTIDKYMGDAIMAFWGAPIRDPQHAQKALKTGIGLTEKVRELRQEFQARGWPELHVGIGINSGRMSVGNMGSEFRMAYTVMGDAVNLGSRLESLTKVYGVELIIGESTRNQAHDYVFRELDRVRVKGKDEPVTIYEPLGKVNALNDSIQSELELYNQALKYYRSENWDLAELQFINLQKLVDRPLYTVYLNRIRTFRVTPPAENWDGVYSYEFK